MKLDLLGLHIESPIVHPHAANFRPPSWPPPPDWPPILNADGEPACFYRDSIWPLDVWAGTPCKLNFGDGQSRGGKRIDSANAELLRQCTTWFMYGPRGCRTAGALKQKFMSIKPLFAICSQEGILASNLMRFDAVIDKVAQALAKSVFGDVLSYLHDILDASELLGFCLLNQEGLARLAKLRPTHEKEQTPYIPPRIWTYQLKRLRACMQDYIEHQDRIEDCFRFCVEAYAARHGSLRAAMRSTADIKRIPTPFANRPSTCSCTYIGPFKLTADRFGVTDLLERWTGPFTNAKSENQIIKLSSAFKVTPIG